MTPRTVACQTPPSMGFFRPEYWRGLPFPSLGDLPDPGIEPRSPTLQADSLPSEPPGNPKKNDLPSLRFKLRTFRLWDWHAAYCTKRAYTNFPFSRGSSQTRDQTQVSCIADRFFTSWATLSQKKKKKEKPTVIKPAISSLALTLFKLHQ